MPPKFRAALLSVLLPPPAWILSLLPTGLLAYDEEDEPWHERLYLARLGSSAWRVVLTPDDDMFLELCSDENEDVTAVRYTCLSVWAQPMASRSIAFGVGLAKLILPPFLWKLSVSPMRPCKLLTPMQSYSPCQAGDPHPKQKMPRIKLGVRLGLDDPLPLYECI